MLILVMNDQFIFICTNIGNEKLLKEEIKTFYPELDLSYSRKGFLTFKNKGVHYDLKSISQLQVTFSTRVGICLGKLDPQQSKEEIESRISDELKEIGGGEALSSKKLMIHNFNINTDYVFDKSLFSNRPLNEYSAEGKLVLNLMTLGQNELWFGVHRVAKGITRYPNSIINIKPSLSSPSNGCLKIAQVCLLNAINIRANSYWLDFGCAPGGASSWLLSKGANVWGIDTAVTHQDVLSHPRFQFIKSSVQDLSQEKLPDIEIEWVHIDLNINPKQAIKEVLRLCKKYNSSLKGIIFTIQVIRIDIIECIEEFEDIFYDWGFHMMQSSQVPAHKSEYVLIARR